MRLFHELQRRRQGAALIIVLALVVLVTGLVVAYFSRTVSDRQIAQGSFHQSSADQLAASAADIIIGDLRQEISDPAFSTVQTFGPSASPSYLYTPISNANMVPFRSGNPPPIIVGVDPIPNLVRISNHNDPPGTALVSSRASNIISTATSANGRSITLSRWNKHYLVPKLNTSSGDDSTDPVASFVAPDWVFVTNAGPTPSPAPSAVTGRYAYAVYDEAGLLDVNVAGYPSGTSAVQSGRKGSTAFADLTALGTYPIPNSSSPFQVDRIVGWRNYATTQASNNFPDSAPAPQAFAKNLQDPATATVYYNYVINNASGFLTVRSNPSPSPYPWNERTDQMFLSRQELISFRDSTQFSSNALQYLGSFSRATNSPSFSPSTPPGSTIDYAYIASLSSANEPTAVNPSFLRRRVLNTGTPFMRFDGTSAVVGEPLVKTRFPLSRLAWLTFKGPSAVVYAANNADPAISQLTAAGVALSTIQTGTAANIKAYFGLVWDPRNYVAATATVPSIGQQWVYASPSSTNGGGNFVSDPVAKTASGNPASDIKRLDIVASENREPDFFELLRATILDGSLGQNTGGGVTGGTAVFPDIHMSNKAHHILSIGAAIIDQADPDSVPTRIQFSPGSPPASSASMWWTAYGIESLPYITQLFPISGFSPATGNTTKWATYLLFQLANPHNGPPTLSPAAPPIRLRVDGNIAIFTGGNGETYASSTNKQIISLPATGVSIPFGVGAFAPASTPSPLATPGNIASGPAVGSALAPAGFEVLPPRNSGGANTSIENYVGLRLLPDYTLTGAGSGAQKPQVTLYLGTDSTHPFNMTMEYDAGGGTWVPYNHFIGLNDRTSWTNGATLFVRAANNLAGTPLNTINQFNTGMLVQSPAQHSLMKTDPRSIRFGIFQMDTNPTTNSRLTEPFWPAGSSNAPNGYGGAIIDGTPANSSGVVEHAPLRFSGVAGAAYYPATFSINNGQTNSIRNTVTTNYADNDGIIRPGDAAYPDPTRTSTGSSTPWSSYTVSSNTQIPYWPIIINRPFRNVGELGYAFRDLPWKSLDLFSDKSADAGLLDVFSLTDEPAMVAGRVNLNTRQAAPLQAVLAGAIWDELNSGNSYSKATTAIPPPPDCAQTMAPLVVSGTSITPARNRSELVSRAGFPNQVLPVYTGTTANQTDQLVKAQREAVPRALASVVQARTWNLMIDVIAQTGRYAPGVTDLSKFIVQGEQRYWVHVAIDRFSGEVIDKQIEVVNE